MSNASAILARLNELRVANELKPLKHPTTIAKMEAEIERLAPSKPSNDRTSWVANLARHYGVNPKVGRSLIRRHVGYVTELNEADHREVVEGLFRESAQRVRA